MKWVNDGHLWEFWPESWIKPTATTAENGEKNKAAPDLPKRKHQNSKAANKKGTSPETANKKGTSPETANNKGTSPETAIRLDDDDDHIPAESAKGSPATVILRLDDDGDEVGARNLRLKRKREQAEEEMERRKKKRVEEMRRSQNKNAQELKIKEALRGSISKDLEKLQRSCRSMASLLQKLGLIQAGKAPSPSDVRLAYKKALLTFHPDRVSRSDVRMQVEAEEKFKLISRMKEKFNF